MTAPDTVDLGAVTLALHNALEALADTPDGIAEQLVGLGVQAVCGDPLRCALAVHLTPAAPEGYHVEVGGSHVYLYSDVETSWPRPVLLRLELPLAAQMFVMAFDMGLYPDLALGFTPPAEVTA